MSHDQEFLEQWEEATEVRENYEALPINQQDPDVLAELVANEKSCHECYLNRDRTSSTDPWITE
jgi:hypothetical protein